MSHVATVAGMFIVDLDAFEVACQQCGLELIRDQTTHRWFGRSVGDYNAQDAAQRHGIDEKQFGKCVHAVRVAGDTAGRYYEIGLVARPDGQEGFVPIYDFWGPGAQLKALCGGDDKLSKLHNSYLEQATLNVYNQDMPGENPWQIQRSVLADGRVQLVMER